MRAQLGQILDQKIQTKNPIATSEEPKQTNKQKMASGPKSGYCICPRHISPQRGGQTTSATPAAQPWARPALAPFKDQARRLRSKQGDLTFAFAPSYCSSIPVRPCLSFLSGLRSVSIDWGRSRTFISIDISLIYKLS